MKNQFSEFELLLHRYLNGTLREDERTRFYEMIASGQFDELLSSELFDTLHIHRGGEPGGHMATLLDELYNDRIRPHLHPNSTGSLRSRPTLFSRWSIAASVTILLSLAVTWMFKNSMWDTHGVETVSSLSEETENIFRLRDKQYVRLPEGSTVLMNQGAELTYDPQTFGVKDRVVQLKGEAFFGIVSDPERLFIVESGSVKTTVLGTAFNVRAIPEEEVVQITVSRGKVKVGDQSGTYELLSADQQVTIHTGDNTFSKKELKSSIVTEWTKDFLILDDVMMAEAARQISRKFKVDVNFKNEKLKECYVTASFLNGETLDHVLEVISTIHDFKYDYQKDKNLVEFDGETSCE